MGFVDSNKKVAVIGSGISAISAAWFLCQKHQVVVFEKNARLGGHTNTVSVKEAGKTVNVDTGFIVFNRPNYPNLTKLFKHLNVKTQNTDMSFAVTLNNGEIEYSGTDINGLFAQRKNVFSWAHWSMIFEILRFNKLAKNDLASNQTLDLSLGEYLAQNGFSSKMQNHYLLPMAAAIWSCPVEVMMSFPTRSFLQFFENHGLLNVEDRPQWETVVNGSKTYLDAIVNNADFDIRLNSPVIKVEKTSQGLLVECQGQAPELFDEVVFGCHADETFQILSADLKPQFSLLEHFNYQENIAYLHTDSALMPTTKRAWSSWNYLRDTRAEEDRVAVSYWMNLLQNLESEIDYFVTLNPIKKPAKDKTIAEIVYQHPVFDQAAMKAQQELMSLQGKEHIWLCGSYFGYGFHEDGLTSAINMVEQWGIKPYWENALSSKTLPGSLNSAKTDKALSTESQQKVG